MLNRRKFARTSAVAATLLLIALAGTVMAQTSDIVQIAAERLARRLEVPVDSIILVSVEKVEWPSSALGVERYEASASDRPTPGYRVILDVAGQLYRYHTDMGRRVVLAGLPESSATPEAPAPTGGAIDRARADLAERLGIRVADIKAVSATPLTFPDGSLGLPRPGEAYVMMLTQGQAVVLASPRRHYLYTCAGNTCRYGGPLDSWAFSALYVEPIMNEPNLNGNLMHISLAGTNPTPILAGVSEFYPQHDGSVIATRRTSRSGHVLLYLAPGKRDEAVTLAGAFSFGQATVNADGTRWIAFSRRIVGSGWQVTRGSISGGEEPLVLDLPDGARPLRLFWDLDNPIAKVELEGRPVYYELVGEAWRETNDYCSPEVTAMVLNRSQSLAVEVDTTGDKPVTGVSTVWFTGARTPVAKIEGFEVRQTDLSADKRFVLLWGAMGEKLVTLTVDTVTGEILHTLDDHHGPVRLFNARGPVPPVLTDVIKPRNAE
ncbi:MAG: hypothetical protein HPY44_11310 [Armatimonadetes bacterium]|nr:hypothetical protein [Armatimonadota bacterium]